MSLPCPSPSFPPLQVGDQLLDASELVDRLQRYGLMPALVKEIVIDQAIAPIALDAAETATAVDSFLTTNQLASEEQRDAFLQQRGLSLANLEPLARRQLQVQKFKLETWGNQIESYFLQRKTQMDRVLYSLIRTKEPGLAQELFFRIQDDGQPFADLARQFSEGQEAQTGGLIGPVELAVPHPALARVLSISQPGQLWPPTRVGEWFVIVRLEKFLPAKLDEATRQRLLDELFNSWLIEQVQQVLQANALTSPATALKEVSEPL